MILHWSVAPSSTLTKKRRQAGVQLKDGDVPDDTAIVTGPVQTGGGSLGFVPSDEHPSSIAQLKAANGDVRINLLLDKLLNEDANQLSAACTG
jgi:hypothetical protein